MNATRPVAARIAIKASASGSSAATTAPKAISKTTSVIGKDSISARRRSRKMVSLTALLMVPSPVSAIWICGWAAAAACTAASTGTTRVASSTMLPVSWNSSSAACRFAEIWLAYAGIERRPDLGHPAGGLDPGQHVPDRGLIGRRADLEAAALEQHVLVGAQGKVPAHHLLRLPGLSGPRFLGGHLHRPGQVTGHQQHHDNGEPCRDRRPRVTGAPPADHSSQPSCTSHTPKLGRDVGARESQRSRKPVTGRPARGGPPSRTLVPAEYREALMTYKNKSATPSWRR